MCRADRGWGGGGGGGGWSTFGRVVIIKAGQKALTFVLVVAKCTKQNKLIIS